MGLPYDKPSLARAQDRIVADWKRTMDAADKTCGEEMTMQPMTQPEIEAVARVDEAEKGRLQIAAGIPHLPTDLTYECRMAIAGEGPRAYAWSDKPHRLVYDLCREIEREAALASRQMPGREEVAAAIRSEMLWPPEEGSAPWHRSYLQADAILALFERGEK